MYGAADLLSRLPHTEPHTEPLMCWAAYVLGRLCAQPLYGTEPLLCWVAI